MGALAVLLSNPIDAPHTANLAALNEDFTSLPVSKSEMLNNSIAT